MAIVIRGQDVEIPGIRSISWREDPALALSVPEDGRRRAGRSVTAITLHTTVGKVGVVKPGVGPSRDIARKNVIYWRRAKSQAGAHLLVDTDGLVVCTCDVADTVAYHAGHVNGHTVGIEICQAAGPTLWQEQLLTAVRLVDFLTAALGIQRQIPHAYARRLARLADDSPPFVGVHGHRDVTNSRGRGDPGDEVFALLAAAGYERFDLAARADVSAWKERQRALGMSPAECDGIPGPRTRAVLAANGHADGLWVARPPFEAPRARGRGLAGSRDVEPADARPLPAHLRFGGDLARRAKGKRVKLLQELLSLAGERVSIDASFGPATEHAVKALRARLGLGDGGVVDEAVWRALVGPFARALRAVEGTSGLGARVVAVAAQHLAEHPVEVGGENRGPWVRLYTDGEDGEPWRWCAGFATWVVREAATSLGVPMPLLRTLGCDELARDARKRKQLVTEADLEAGRFARADIAPGSLFLVRRTPTDWTHTGIVTRAHEEFFETIEGNTNDDGSPNGYEVCVLRRQYRSIDFALLAPRG